MTLNEEELKMERPICPRCQMRERMGMTEAEYAVYEESLMDKLNGIGEYKSLLPKVLAGLKKEQE